MTRTLYATALISGVLSLPHAAPPTTVGDLVPR